MAKAMRLRWMRFAAIMIHGLFGRGRGKAPASEGGRYKKRVEFARTHWAVRITAEKRRQAVALHRLLGQEGGVEGDGFAAGIG